MEDPGRELSPEIVELTGLTDADVAGKAFDDGAILRLLRSADWLCAHNARFDADMVVRRFPDAAGMPWACSLNDVDWRAAGLDGGRTLGWLLSRIGLFHGAHRAGDDVDAVIALLMHGLRSGRTVLAEMLERASAPSWRFRAVGAAFELRDLLRARGYRWDAERLPKAWWREVPDADRVAEEWWLAGHVYSGDAHPKALGPVIERITWRERYARPA